MPLDEEHIRQLAENPEGRAPFDDIAHERSFCVNVELVLVAQPRKRAAHHLVHEAARRRHFNDPCHERLPDAEVPPFEGDEVTELEETAHPSGRHETLSGKRRRARVDLDVTRQIEARFDRDCDYGFDDDFAHESFSVAVRLNTSRPPVESGSTAK